MSVKKVLLLSLFCFMCSISYGEENLKSIGKFKDWESFILIENQNKIIYKFFFMDMDLDILFVHH